MTDSRCWSVVQRLLENLEAPAADDVRHARDCERCASMIAQAAKLDSLITAEEWESTSPTDERLIEQTTRRASTTLKRARLVFDFVIAAIVAAGAANWFIVAGFYMGWAPFIERSRPEFLSDALISIFPISALLGIVLGLSVGRLFSRRPAEPSFRGAWIPIALLIALLAEYRFAQFLARNHDSWFAWGIGAVMLTAAVAGFLPGRAGLPYKRLRAGRQISGVCAGIAEKSGVPVALIRLAFLALLFAKLFGILLYLVLDMLMEVHPDDRASLLRFRIRRWWSSRFGVGEAAGVSAPARQESMSSLRSNPSEVRFRRG